MKKVLPIFALPLLFTSCDSNTACVNCTTITPEQVEVAEVTPEIPKTDADELLRALGGRAFTVELPDDLPEKFYVGLSFKYPDGSIKRFGRTGPNTNECKTARVFLFPSKIVSGYDYSILMEVREKGGSQSVIYSSQSHSSLTVPPHNVTMPAPQGLTVKPEDGLIRFAEEGSDGAHSGKLKEGNFDIIFQITPYGED